MRGKTLFYRRHALEAQYAPCLGSPARRGRRRCAAGLPERDEIAAYHLMDEMRLVGGLVERAIFTATERNRIADRAARLVSAARANRHKHGGVDAFMHEYGLTSEEGIILMCLAEALLRIPDKDTADALIAEKIGGGRWEKHLGHSDSLFVNASTFGLMITGRVVKLGEAKGAGPGRRPQAPGGALGRALHPPGAAPGHEDPGRQLRARPHHRGGAGARRAARSQGLSLLLRHAGRARQDGRRRRRATSSRYMSAIEAVGNAAPRARRTDERAS